MNFLKNIQKGASKLKFKAVKRSPEILMIFGTVSVVGGVVLACKQTFKFEEIIDEHNEKLEKRREIIDEYGEEYSISDQKSDVVKIYATTSVKVLKTYALPAILIGSGIASMFLAKSIVSKRYMAALTAFNGLSEAFSAYRDRVRERFGEDTEKEIFTNAKPVEVIGTDEKGKEITETIMMPDGELKDISIYARFFDPSCSQWEKNAEYNLTFLKGQEQFANDILKTRGHLFLNEVYDMLGFDHSQAGSLVGWIYDENNPDIDNYVDFGIYNLNSAPNRSFVNGFEPVILLDFNVDGVIWDKI